MKFSEDDIAYLFLLPFHPQLDQYAQVPGTILVNEMWRILGKAIIENNEFCGMGFNDVEARERFISLMLHGLDFAVPV